MTSYTCKRLCCAVVIVENKHGIATDVTLNGVRVLSSELAARAGLSKQGMNRRLCAHGCLQMPRRLKHGVPRKPKAPELLVISDSGRLAARFNQLPRNTYVHV